MVAKKTKEVTFILTVAELAKAKKRLAYADNSVDSCELIHLLPYLTPVERINLMNELQRVLKKGSKCQMVMPHWSSNRAYADLRFQFPPVAESWFFSLNDDYRKQDKNSDTRYKCNFGFTCGYSLHPSLISRNQEYQQHAITFWKEAAQDMIATIIKK